MSRTARNILLAPLFLFFTVSAGIAFAQERAPSENARTLSKKEVLALISNKKITYLTAAAADVSSVTEGKLQIAFTKTEDSGGTLMAYSSARGARGSSSGGKWHVDDESKLVRQYDQVKWGNKPFRAGIVEKNGKYFVRFGAAEDHEIVKIE